MTTSHSDLEKENTFRALRDEELIVTSKWCRWGIHQWTRWTAHSKSNVGYGGFNMRPYRRYVFERYCVDCDHVQRRRRVLVEEDIK